MLRRNKIIGMILILVVILALAGCGSTAKEPEKQSEPVKIKIGSVGPLTGTSAQDGNAMKNATILAVELVNKAGGINGAQIEVIAEDDKSDPKEAAAVANKFAADKDVIAVIGHYNSSCTLAGAPIYNKAGIAEVSGGSSSPAVSAAGPCTFRTITTDAFQGRYVIGWAVKEEGFKKIAVVYENTDYGKGIQEVVKEEAGKNGASVVAEEAYIMGQTKDFSAMVTKIKKIQPDVIIIGGLYNEAALFAKQAKRSGLNTPMMGVDGLYTEPLIELGGDAVEGLRMIGFYHESNQNKETQDFINAYKAKFNEIPGTYAAYTFDATNVVLEALKKGAKDRKGVVDYLTTLKDFKGVTGNTSFDANGDCIKDPIKLIVKDGKFDFYK